MDGRSRDSANLINQVRNQPCKKSKPSHCNLVPPSQGTAGPEWEPPQPSLASLLRPRAAGRGGEVGCDGGHRASGSRDQVSVTPSEHRGRLRPHSLSPVHPGLSIPPPPRL